MAQQNTEPVLMEYNGDAQALLRTERMPSGTIYEYSASPAYKTTFAHPDDVKELEKIGFQRGKTAPVELPPADATQEEAPARERSKK